MELGASVYTYRSFLYETNASNQIVNYQKSYFIAFYDFSSLLLLVVSALPDTHEDLQTERCT